MKKTLAIFGMLLICSAFVVLTSCEQKTETTEPPGSPAATTESMASEHGPDWEDTPPGMAESPPPH